MGAQTEEVLARWDDEAPCDMVLVRPELGSSATFAVDRMVTFIEEGYRAAYRARDSVRVDSGAGG